MKSSTDMEKGSGEDILRCLNTILERCADFDARNRFPGEGGERRFRMWLATDFLTDLMGWPAQLIVQGERFDLLLEDEHGSPLLTFETKTPYHETSAAERRDFVGRLSAFPTLRTGVLTNGDRWEIYRIEHTLGSASVHPIADFRLDDLTFIAPPRVGQRRKVEALLAIVDTLTRGGGSMDAAKLEAMELQINEIVDVLLQATT